MSKEKANFPLIVAYAAVALILGGVMMLSAPLAAQQQQITYSLTAVYAHAEGIRAENVPAGVGLKFTVHQNPQQQDWPGSYRIEWQLTRRGVNPSEADWHESGGEDKASLTGPAPGPGEHTMHCRVRKILPSPSDPVVVARDFTAGQIQVVELDFIGPGNHSIKRAVTGASDTETVGNPEWCDRRRRQGGGWVNWPDGIPERVHPFCYTRNVPMQVTTTFRCFRPSAEGTGHAIDVALGPDPIPNVTIRGTATGGMPPVEYLFETTQSIVGAEFTATMSAVPALPNQIDYIDLQNDFLWGWRVGEGLFRYAGDTWGLWGYVTLAAPSGTCHETSLYHTCTIAKGRTDPNDAATAIWAIFTSPGDGVSKAPYREDETLAWVGGEGLEYWRTDNPKQDLKGLLLFTDGSCVAWADFLVNCLGVHGIVATSVEIIADDAVNPPPRLGWVAGFLVKRWTFTGGGTSGNPNWPYIYPTEVTDETGVPGQNNPNPPGGFYNHFITRRGTDLLDPSYGAGPYANNNLLQWKTDSIDGYIAADPLNSRYVAKRDNTGIQEMRFLP